MGPRKEPKVKRPLKGVSGHPETTTTSLFSALWVGCTSLPLTSRIRLFKSIRVQCGVPKSWNSFGFSSIGAIPSYESFQFLSSLWLWLCCGKLQGKVGMLCLTVLAKIWEGTTQIESQVMLHHLELRLHIYLKSVASSSAEFSWSLVNHHFVVCISGVAVGLGESGVALSRCNRPPASCICCTTNTFRLGNA